jgi:xanthine dehydrogenase YagR molybdenum-binding subunit
MTQILDPHAIGTPLQRVDGPAKVTGRGPYAFEQPVSAPLYLHPLQSTVARGRISAVDAGTARATDGVVEVLTHENAPELADTAGRDLAILQSEVVSYRGQLIGAVIATSPEVARQAAGLVRFDYDESSHDATLSADCDELYTPGVVNGGFAPDTAQGDVDEALRDAAVRLEATYNTPMEHNNPMEPHATVATWTGEDLRLYDSTQGVHTVRAAVATTFGLDPEHVHVAAPYVGGGFGSKGEPHPHVVLAALAARALPGRTVKFAVTRQEMYSFVGYRSPTVQRFRLGADSRGRLTAIAHDVIAQTARLQEFAEQAAVPSRTMYAAGNRRSTHRLDPLDVPVPSWMRAPGECPGMYGLESAVDEMSEACGLDPIEFRARNEPELDPESGRQFSSRRLLACLREGAERFGWADRDPTPGVRRVGNWLIGTGVAASTYPVNRFPASRAAIRFQADGRYRVEIGSADIGTGAWTALSQIAADALDVPAERIEMQIGDTGMPFASVAGGSSGTTTWGSAIYDAARTFREKFGSDPDAEDEAEGSLGRNPDTEHYRMDAYGAYFAEVWVDADTGEVRVPRMLGYFDAGRIINPRTARSQFRGGMVMGIGMALHEVSVLDPRFGHVVNHDLAEYHIPTNADVGRVEVHWLDTVDEHTNPMGSKGIGEIGIVGSPAAIGNAVYHATGRRMRNLPITPDKLI